MRFDDSLRTILSADMETGAGAEAAWRQLVDLVGRSRIPADEPVIARLRLLRQAVPVPVRAATGRALAFATPGAAIVGFFAEDTLAVAAPVLRTAILPAADWLAILPRMSAEGRSVLRHRRDLPGDVVRGLASFGSTDFVLDYDGAAAADPVRPEPPLPAPDTPRSATPFVALGAVARDLPIVAEALRRAEPLPKPEPVAPARFEISDLVARLDAFNRDRDTHSFTAPPVEPATSFRYRTDASGLVTWADGVNRAAIVGVSIAHAVRQGEVSIDAVMSGALRQRARFTEARLDIGGASDAAGSWRVAGEPAFDEASGRFIGFRGIARRPRPDESAAPATRQVASESLRQLVHELRTPTNAIAGFAELIESQLLGPVEAVYRTHATSIRDQAAMLLAAIDDLDTAARIEGGALDLRATAMPLDALLAQVARTLEPLSDLRRVVVRIEPLAGMIAMADDRALERLLSRLLAALITLATPREVIAVSGATATPGMVALRFSRPRALAESGDDPLLSINGDDDGVASLLGTGFALRLARNLARELGGEFAIAADSLTLRLPAAASGQIGHTGR